MACVTPKVSVVIPTFNRAEYILQSINSVLRQTVQPDEIIVVDDGSTDDTEEIVRNFGVGRIKYLRKEHTGAPDTRNRGLEIARGDYVITVASDDVAFEHLVERHLDAHFRDPGLDLYCGDLIATNADLEPFMRVKYPRCLNDSRLLLSTSAFTNQIGDPFTMLRRSWALEIGGYDLKFSRCQDWDMWTRRMDGFRVKHIGGDLGSWRWHSTNLSANRKDPNRLSYDRIIRDRVLKARNGWFHIENLGWSALIKRDQRRPILIWGAGEYGEAMLRMLEWMGFSISGYVDSNSSKNGSVFEGFRVRLPVGLDTESPLPIVVIASVYEHEIAAALDLLGYRENLDYFRLHGVEYHKVS